MLRSKPTPTDDPGQHMGGVGIADTISAKHLKILVVTPYFFPLVGGAELLIYEIFKRIAKKASVTVLTPEVPAKTKAVWGSAHPVDLPFQVVQFDNRLCLTQIRGQRFMGGLPPVSISAMPAILNQCRLIKPDVIFCFYAKTVGIPALAAGRLAGCPVVSVVCGTDLANEGRPRLWPTYGRFLLKKADASIYVSHFAERQFWGNKPQLSNTQIVPNGVDLSVFDSNLDGSAIRTKLNIGPDEIMLLAMQRLAPLKRVDIVIKSLPYILQAHPRVKLVVAGIGSEAGKLKALVSRMGLENNVSFTGFLGCERPQYLAAADIFVFHSCVEAFGLVVAEAMAMGKPIVTVGNSAIPEVVEDGKTALLSRTLDEKAMAEKVIRLIENPKLAKELGKAAEDKAKKCFDIEVVAENYLEIARSVLIPSRHTQGRLQKRL